MDIKLTLENKQLYPSVINLRQFSNNTDIIKFEMPDYMYETTDLSKMPCYAVCDMGGKIDEVKLTTEVVGNKLKITWKVTGYTTQIDGHINYSISFKDIQNEESILWFSHQGIIFVNSSIDADGYIAAKYPSILQQWEERMNSVDSSNQEKFDELVSGITEKVENGDFDGKTILYGEGIPAKTLGNIGDVYVNTAQTALYPFYLFTKDGEDWTPRWSMKSVNADTLPLLGTLFLPESQAIPPGYEEIENFHIPLSWISGFDTFQGKLDGISNPNLLINGDFAIWQRENGKKDYSFTSPAVESEYVSDRWLFLCNASSNKNVNAKLNDKGNVIIKNSGTSEIGITYCQRVELIQSIKKRLANEKVTISFMMKSTVPFESGCQLSFRTASLTNVGAIFKTYQLTNEFKKFEFTFEMGVPFDGDYTALEVSLFASSRPIPAGAEVEIDWVKLEFGEFATPYVPRLYTEELNLCRRYYLDGNVNFSIETPHPGDNKTIIFSYPFSVEMLGTPTVTFNTSAYTNGLYSPIEEVYKAVSEITSETSKETFYVVAKAVDNLNVGYRYRLARECIAGIDAEIK